MSTTKNMRDGSIKVSDGTLPTANELLIALSGGDLEWTEERNVTAILDRGKLSHFRGGDEVPVSVSFSLKYVELIKQAFAAEPTLYEALKFLGAASGWQTTNADECSDIKTLDLTFLIASPCPSEEDEEVVFSKFYYTSINPKEGEEFNTIDVEGTAFITAPLVSKV